MVLTSLVFVLLMGVLPALWLTRSAFGIPLAGAVVLVTSALGAVLGTAMGVSVVRLVFGLAVIANVAAAVLLYRRQHSLERPRFDWSSTGTGLALVAWFTVPSVALLGLYPPGPIGWDSRSVWWFHASWFQYGGDVVRDGLANPAVAFSQPHYPPGVPAAIATLWRATGGSEDLWLAQSFTSVLTGLALASLALMLVHEHRDGLTIAAATALVGAAVPLGSGLAANGYVDVLSAALLVTALAAYVCIHDLCLAIGGGSISLAAAAVTKNEGFVFGALVLVVVIIATTHRRRIVAAAGVVALIPAVLWNVVFKVWGVDSPENLGAESPGDFLGVLSGTGWERLKVAGPAVIRETYLIVVPAIVVLLLLAVALWREGDRPLAGLRPLRPALAFVSMAILSATVAASVYAAGGYEMVWWLGTSLERVSSTPKLFALAALVSMTPVAGQLWGRRGAVTADQLPVAGSTSEPIMPSDIVEEPVG